MSGPQSFGRYRVTGTLGAGAMGEVLAAVDELLGREVAVKTLRGRTSGLAARIADERFRLEARAIAQLTHPSVVQVYDLDLAADPPYLVMERVAGPSLKERLEGGPLPEAEVRALGIQIANALATAHARGVVHRDVKPANILGAGPGTWKLADFGVAHVPDSSLTLTGQFVGSPAYAAPEALIRGQLGPEGDVFGLGATLYQAAAGTWPRADAEIRGLLAPVPPLQSLAPSIAPELAAAIDRAVAVDPAARPSAAELALAIAAGSAGVSPAVAAVALPPPGPLSASTVHVPDWPAGGAATADGSVGGWRADTSGASGTSGTSGTGTSSGVGWSAAGPGTSGAGTAAGGPSAGASGTYGGPSAGASSTYGARPATADTSTTGGAPAVKPTNYRWKHTVAGIATLLAIILIAATRCSQSGPPGTAVTSPVRGGGGGGGGPADPDERRDVPTEINAKSPPISTEEEARDWYKVVDKLQRHQFGEARRKLAEWETKHGETPETRDLASQLDALPEEMLRGGPRGRRRRDD